MAREGYDQGDMSPKVESYQKPESSFAEGQFGTTTEYIARQDKFVEKEAKGLKGQAYKGRYS